MRTLLCPSGDDRDEMTTAADDSAVEDAFEALLAGRPVPAEAALLAAFTDAVRADAKNPGRPSPQLAQLLVGGLPSAGSAGPVAAGPSPIRPSAP